MDTRSKTGVTLGLLIALIGLGAADYYLLGNETVAQLAPATGDETQSDPAKTRPDLSREEIDAAAAAAGLETRDVGDVSLLAQLVRQKATVEATAVLSKGDRAGFVAWTSTPDAYATYLELKEALLPAFTAGVRDLKDETIQPAQTGQPVRYLLTFFDPGISEERIVFYLSGNDLYEFRIAEGNDDVMYVFIESLAQR